MNAIVNDARAPAPAAPTTARKLGWLLRRELWEHRGGFIWAPIMAGGMVLLLTLVGLATGQWALRRQGANVVNWNGQEVPLSQVDWNQLLAGASPEDLRQYAEAANALTVATGFLPLLVFAFVVFFYLLGALYDERKDRSILFWKSLPVSDGLTVWSKLLTALVVAPLIVTAVGMVTMLAFGLLLSLLIMINGGNPWAIYWSHLQPHSILGATLGTLPIYVLWALPTAGWLLLCSAWARSKPFLWAVLVPILAGAALSWLGMMGGRSLGLDTTAFWQHGVARLLTGTFPGSHLLGYVGSDRVADLFNSNHMFYGPDSVAMGLHLFTTPQLWIGVAAGIAMILLAIRLRRWRDEG